MKITIVIIALATLLAASIISSYLVFTNSEKDTWTQVVRTIVAPTARFPIPSAQPWSLLITGDVIPARVVNQKMVEKNDFRWPLVHFFDILKNADITLINLEAPLITNCPLSNEGFKFCGDARFVASLAEAGVDVANVANNHTLNYGWEGLAQTEEHLKSVGIETTGFAYSQNVIPVKTGIQIDSRLRGNDNNDTFSCAQNTFCSAFVTKKVGDITLGFLGYNAVGQYLDRTIAEQQIRVADSLVDVLVVSIHWGKEYTREPETDSIAADDPKELGRLFVDWGADVVAGNHPHWYQSIEWYAPTISAEHSQSVSAKPIIYAQGNFVFDQEWSLETKRGYLAKLFFDGTQILKDKTEIIPVGIRDYGQAYLLEGAEKEEIIRFLLD